MKKTDSLLSSFICPDQSINFPSGISVSITHQVFQHQLPIRYFSVNYPSGISTYRFNHLVLAIIFTWHGALDFTSGYGTQGWSVPSREYTCDILLFFSGCLSKSLSSTSWTHVSYLPSKWEWQSDSPLELGEECRTQCRYVRREYIFLLFYALPFNLLSLL